jgi:hypothetical protein
MHMTGYCTNDDTHEQYTLFCQGFRQLMVFNSNIVLGAAQCLRYVNAHDISADFRQYNIACTYFSIVWCD